jgi:hypothetical protein
LYRGEAKDRRQSVQAVRAKGHVGNSNLLEVLIQLPAVKELEAVDWRGTKASLSNRQHLDMSSVGRLTCKLSRSPLSLPSFLPTSSSCSSHSPHPPFSRIPTHSDHPVLLSPAPHPLRRLLPVFRAQHFPHFDCPSLYSLSLPQRFRKPAERIRHPRTPSRRAPRSPRSVSTAHPHRLTPPSSNPFPPVNSDAPFCRLRPPHS